MEADAVRWIMLALGVAAMLGGPMMARFAWNRERDVAIVGLLYLPAGLIWIIMSFVIPL